MKNFQSFLIAGKIENDRRGRRRKIGGDFGSELRRIWNFDESERDRRRGALFGGRRRRGADGFDRAETIGRFSRLEKKSFFGAEKVKKNFENLEKISKFFGFLKKNFQKFRNF